MAAVIEISALTQPTADRPDDQTLKLRRITVKEYDLMITSGVFGENDHIELLNGVIIEKMPKGTKHSSTNDRAARVFYRTLGDRTIIRNQNPIWLDELSEPEPDIVLARPREDDYETTHPTPDEIFLILEIADSTVGYDRNTKGLAYARAGIKQYLLINVQDRTLEDYREPGADGFQSRQTYRAGQNFSLVAFPSVLLPADDFLPAAKD